MIVVLFLLLNFGFNLQLNTLYLSNNSIFRNPAQTNHFPLPVNLCIRPVVLSCLYPSCVCFPVQTLPKMIQFFRDPLIAGPRRPGRPVRSLTTGLAAETTCWQTASPSSSTSQCQVPLWTVRQSLTTLDLKVAFCQSSFNKHIFTR